MAIPRQINPNDYKNNQQLMPLLGILLTQAGFDAEDQDIFLVYMFANDKPDIATIDSIAQKYHTTPEIIQKHAESLYKKIGDHPFVKDLLPKQ
jgi:predicted metal-dependent phosphoesterase TrpH